MERPFGLLRPMPETGFDDAYFGLLDPNPEGGLNDWTFELKKSIRHVPGGGISVLQMSGVGHAQVSWRVYCETVEEYRTLLAKLGVTGILVLPAYLQSLRGTVSSIQEALYESLSDVTMIDISSAVFSVDGRVETTCTFVRAIDPLTGGVS